MSQQAAQAARRQLGSSSGYRVSMVVIGLAVAARLVRDTRTHEAVIMVVIAVAAVAGLGRDRRARSWARLVAWDRRRNASERGALAAPE